MCHTVLSSHPGVNVACLHRPAVVNHAAMSMGVGSQRFIGNSLGAIEDCVLEFRSRVLRVAAMSGEEHSEWMCRQKMFVWVAARPHISYMLSELQGFWKAQMK